MFATFCVTSGRWVVSGSEDGAVYVWDLQTRQVLQKLGSHACEWLAHAAPTALGARLL